jgi:tRNA pseudouridine65 synthase
MLDILYQDEHLVAVNKPAGWLVHRSWLDRNEKVVVMQTVRDQIGQHVFTVHRLDRPTSGVLLLALSKDVARTLSQCFEQHQLQKVYHAVVRGYIDESGIIDYPLLEQLDKIADKFSDPNKDPQRAISHYRRLNQIEVPIEASRYPTSRYSLVELYPQTGRKHQLRRHMSHLSHPIVGDSSYGDLRHNRAIAEHYQCRRLMLHASHLCLQHPVTGKDLLISAPWESQWQSLMQAFSWDDSVPSFSSWCNIE